MKRFIATLALSILGLLALSVAQESPVNQFVILGSAVFPESLSYDAPSGAFYTGSLTDGTLYRGDLKTGQVSVFSPAGADGRSNAAGIKIDRYGRLWVTGGYINKIFAYDLKTSKLIRAYTTPETKNVLPNDLVIADDGSVYITDSLRPVLYRIPTTATSVGNLEEWMSFSDTALTYVKDGLSANGIAVSGSYLLINTTKDGKLYRVDTRDKTVRAVTVSGGSLVNGDGITLTGRTLYVARNADSLISKLELSADLLSAKVVSTTPTPAYAFPTSVSPAGDRLLVLYSQLPAIESKNPVLPFIVSSIPLP